ncbi:MAG TPA: class I SAM-dependent methyltransferase [Caulobacteraceae bacterium]|jgi:SAM-dependent methyltransferase
MLGGFSSQDGTVEFYGRVNALLSPEKCVVDLGAGRGAWHFEDFTAYHRHLRDIRSKVATYIGADVDPQVLENPTTSQNVLIEGGVVPLPAATVDLIIADFVLEHVADPQAFRTEVDRLLKPGGFFCARTPHALNYVSLGARLLSDHLGWLQKLQPTRRKSDIFPTHYRLNTRRKVRSAFDGWADFSYLYAGEPMYFMGNETVFGVMSFLHRFAPAPAISTIFVFLQKPS